MAYVPQALDTSVAYSIDWEDRTPTGAAISTSAWVVWPPAVGVTTATPGIDGLATFANVEVADDAAVGAYVVTNVVAFNDGSTDRQSITLRVAHETEVA